MAIRDLDIDNIKTVEVMNKFRIPAKLIGRLNALLEYQTLMRPVEYFNYDYPPDPCVMANQQNKDALEKSVLECHNLDLDQKLNFCRRLVIKNRKPVKHLCFWEAIIAKYALTASKADLQDFAKLLNKIYKYINDESTTIQSFIEFLGGVPVASNRYLEMISSPLASILKYNACLFQTQLIENCKAQVLQVTVLDLSDFILVNNIYSPDALYKVKHFDTPLMTKNVTHYVLWDPLYPEYVIDAREKNNKFIKFTDFCIDTGQQYNPKENHFTCVFSYGVNELLLSNSVTLSDLTRDLSDKINKIDEHF